MSDWWQPTERGQSDQFSVHARLLGGPLTTDDIMPSSILATVYLILTALAGFRFYQMIKTPKNNRASRGETLLVLAIALFAMTLAFFIRGASGNTSMSGLALSTVLAEQILFTIAYILLLDVSVILLRDIYYQGKSPPEVTNMKTYKRFTFLSHLICLTSIIVSAVGFSQLPSATSTSNTTDTANTLRMVGALMPFLLSMSNLLLWGSVVLVFVKPYTFAGHPHRTKITVMCVVLAFAWFNWPAVFYAFVQVAVTSDDSTLVTSKAFFYLTFGLFQVLGTIAILAIDLRLYLEQGLFGFIFPGNASHMLVDQPAV